MLFKKISHIAKIEFLEPFMIICLQLVDRYVKNTIILTQVLPATWTTYWLNICSASSFV